MNSRRIGSRRSRAAGAVVDQAVASLTNYIVLFAALRGLALDELGAFTVAYTGALLVVVLSRALILDPMAVRFANAEPGAQRQAAGAAAGAAVLLSLLLGMSWLVITTLWGTQELRDLRLLAFVIPLLLTQDSWRSALFCAGRPWAASLNDGVRAMATLLAVFVGTGLFGSTIPMLLVTWGLGALAAALVGIAQLGTAPRLAAGAGWLRHHHDLGRAFAGEVLGERLSGQVAILLVGATGGLLALGKLSATMVILAPVTTLITSVTAFALPEAARQLEEGEGRMARFATVISVVVAAVALIFIGGALIVPDSLGTLVAGDNWSNARDLIVPMGLATAASGARQGPRSVLRALECGRQLLVISWSGAVLLLTGAVVGTAWAGAHGAAWAFAISFTLIAAATGMAASRALAARSNDRVEDGRLTAGGPAS